jgi:hypothetical protein
VAVSSDVVEQLCGDRAPEEISSRNRSEMILSDTYAKIVSLYEGTLHRSQFPGESKRLQHPLESF